MTNNELIQRVDLTLSTLQANSGVFTPEQSDAFIDLIQEQPTMLAQVRLHRMATPEERINRMGFTSRIMRPANQGTAPYLNDSNVNSRWLAAADRSAVTPSYISLTVKEQMAEVHLTYESLEDNIEGRSLESHVMRLIAERAALDLEEYALWGDTSSGDAYLAMHDGYLKRMTSNVVDNASAGITPKLGENGLLTMPQKYLRNIAQLKHFVSMANTIKYRGKVSERQTGYGDSALQNNIPLQIHGVNLEGVPTLAMGANGASGFLTFPKNLIWGVWRNIQVEAEKDIRGRQIIVVLTCRVGLQIEEEAACVKYINI